MRRVLAFLFCLLAVPSWALSPAQEILLLGGGGNSFYANPAATSVVPSWLSYASAGVRYYFDAAGNLQTSPNNLILNSAVFSTQTVAVTSGASYILSATMASGSSIAATGAATSTLNGSGGGTRVFVSFVASSASVTLTMTGAAAQSQLEQVTAAQTTPNPFMPTSGSAYFGPVVNDHNPVTLAALGLRSEPQRTNYIRNNTMQGAAAGVPPTFWTVASSTNGVTLTQGAPVVAFGMTWLPFTFSGTATATITSTSVFFSEGQQQIAAVSGQTWTASFYAYSTGALPPLFVNLAERTSTGATNGNNEVGVPTTSTPKLFQSTKTIASASTAYVVTRLDYNMVAGAVYSGTVYVAAPSTEQNSFATSPILTYGAAVTVPADNWSFTGAALAYLLSKTGACIAVQALAESGEGAQSGRIFSIDDRTSSNRFAITNNAANQVGFYGIGSNGFALNSYVAGGDMTAAPRTSVLSWGARLPQGAYDGTLMTGQSVSGHPNGMTEASIGRDSLGNPSFYGWFQQIMIRPSCTAAQVKAYSTANSNMSH